MSDVVESNASEVIDSLSDDQSVESNEELSADAGSESLTDVVSDIIGEDEGDEEVLDVDDVIQEYKKKLTLKVDGEEIEEELDFNDDERLKRALQKERAFDKRSQELSSLQKQVNQFVDQIKGDPFKMLEQMGIGVEDLVMDYAKKAVEKAEKSPEELRQEEMQQELENLRNEKDQLSKDKETAEMEKIKNQQAADMEKGIKSALSAKETFIPNNSRGLRRIAEAMYFAATNGFPEVTAEDVIPLVEKRMMREYNEFFDESPEDTIERIVGKQNLDRVRKRRVKNRKTNTQTANQSIKNTNNKIDSLEDSSKPKKTFKDLFDPRF